MKRGKLMSKPSVLAVAALTSLGLCQLASAKAKPHANSHHHNKAHLVSHHAATAPKPMPPELSMHNNMLSRLRQKVSVHGFISAGASVGSTPAEYPIPGRGVITNTPTFFPNTVGGVQIHADLNDNFGAAMQLLLASDELTGEADYTVKADYAYIHYSPVKSLEFRLGRIRIPAFMYSDTAQIGYNYPWVFLPNEVYRLLPFYNMNGIDMIWTRAISRDWTASVQGFYGNNQSTFADAIAGQTINPQTGPVAPVSLKQHYIGQSIPLHFHYNNLYGANLGFTMQTAKQTLALRGSFLHTQLYTEETSLPAPAQGTPAFAAAIPSQSAYFYSVGMQYNLGGLRLASEFAQRETADDVYGAANKTASIAALSSVYGMLGYQIDKWLPFFNYGYLTTTNVQALNNTDEHGLHEQPERQQSFTLGTDYTINQHLKAKASGSLVDLLKDSAGNQTAGLYHMMPKDTTQFVGSVELDAIF